MEGYINFTIGIARKSVIGIVILNADLEFIAVP